MRRKLDQYSNCSPTAIAEGSRAQMMHFVEDAKADIASLAKALEFYRDNWNCKPSKRYGGLEYSPTEALLDDCGNTARAALAKFPARLMAAAPDMLTALKAIVDQLDHEETGEPGGPKDWGAHWRGLHCNAAAAIAKATGEDL
jgi:hypothetical protein